VSPDELFQLWPDGTPAGFVAGGVIALKLFVPGEPMQADRPRGRVQYKNGKPWVQFYTERKHEEYLDLIARTLHQQVLALDVQGEGNRDFKLPLAGRILMDVRINKTKPKSYSKAIEYPVQKPDLDNYLKAVLDGLVRSRVILDDSAITDITTRKRFAGYGHPPGVEVDVTILPLGYWP
jgi:Holliday junction resolvase RusA-like endonuclease